MQISGFSYACHLRDQFDLPTVYNNESSLTCQVNQNQVINAYDLSHSGSIIFMDCALGVTVYMLPQIQSSNSAGREDVTVSIIWMNTSTRLQHTIDVLTPVNCECDLVCMVFMKFISQ